jgi:muconate cycloisomerase
VHTSENFIVRCRLADGTEGWGEGVPRDYVTGETPDGAMDQMAATNLSDQFAEECGDWDAVIQQCLRYQPSINGSGYERSDRFLGG